MKAKPIYIGTSLFDVILSIKVGLMRSSLALLEKCKNNLEYQGYISAFTILELNDRCSSKEMEMIKDLIYEYDLKIIDCSLPKDIDYLANCYLQKPTLDERFLIDYYNIACCAFLNIGFYVCWNTEHIVNARFYESIRYVHKPHGYRTNILPLSPSYLLRQDCLENRSAVINKTIESKQAVFNVISGYSIGEQYKYAYGITEVILGINMPTVSLPKKHTDVARIPLLDLTESELDFSVKSYESEISRKEIPLLDLGYGDTGFDMEYYLFKLDVIKGQALLKNKQLALIYHYPTEYTNEDRLRIRAERNKIFIDWILPEVRSAIDKTTDIYSGIPTDTIQQYYYTDIDHKLSLSVMGNSIVTIKRKALELGSFITDNNWMDYQGFNFSQVWCTHNKHHEWGETHLIVEKEGKEIWIVMIERYVP